MMTPRIRFSNLVRQHLPFHKRQPVRLSLLRALVAPLQPLFDRFDLWRSDIRMTLNVTSQVRILEGYLRRKYDQPIAIKIVTYDDGALMVGLEPEGEAQRLDIALDPAEAAPAPDIPLEGEIRDRFGDTDFIVYIPAGTDTDAVTADIERFRLALVRYRIIRN